MKKSIVYSIVIAMAVGVQAGVYTQDFEAAANTSTDLGDGSTIVDSGTGLAQVFDNISWKALRLTQDGPSGAGMTGNYALPDLDVGAAATSFTATFDSLIKNDYDDVADGFSFNFGTLPALPDGGELGMSGGSMLSVAWDTYSGGGRGIEVFVNGASVSRSAIEPVIQPNLGSPFSGTTIVWDETGLDVSYNGAVIFSDLNVSGFTASSGDRFAFAARTGGANEDLFIDNVNVNTIPEPAAMGLMALCGSAAFLVRRIFLI